MPQAVPLARVVRAGLEESIHLGSVAVADATGRLVRSAGDPGALVWARSTMKPVQAAVSLDLAGELPPDPEIAVMASSHNAEPVHLEAVRALLDRAGLEESVLRTPPALPLDPRIGRDVPGPRPILHNCSGKHAGMLLACVRAGLDVASYPDPGHPLQQRVLETVTRFAAREPERIGVDGCGTPVHALPLERVAAIYARLGAAPAADLPDGPAARVVEAMTAEPYLVAGRDRVCTAVMRAAPGVVVKSGAEGMICAGLPERGLGLAIKVADGAFRAADAALIRALEVLAALEVDDRLAPFAARPVLGGGERVGGLVSDFELARA